MLRFWSVNLDKFTCSRMVVTHVLLQSKLILANFVALFALIVCYLVDILDVVLQQDLVLEIFSTIVAYNLVL